MSKAEQDKLKAEKKCFNCKKVGHMANDCPEKVGAPKADGGSAVVKVIRADGGDDLMNYVAIPDSPQYSSIHTRIEELSDVSILNQSYNDSANTRVVNVIQAGKSVGEMEQELRLDMDVDMYGFPLSTNSFSNSVDVISSSFPHVNVDISNVSHGLSFISLVGKGKRKAEETVMVASKCTKMDAEETVVSEEKKIGNGGQRFKIPVVISSINRDAVSCSRTIQALIDTGSVLTILNTRTIVDPLMPWKHRPTSLRIFGANGQRLQKSGKVIVDSVDLKVVDARTQRERTFRPTFEVADLGPADEMIIGMDWMQHMVDSVKLHPCGLVFKSLIDFVEADPEDGVREYIKRAAYVGMIIVYNQ